MVPVLDRLRKLRKYKSVRTLPDGGWDPVSHTPLVTRLLTIATRPETLDLRSVQLPTLSDAQVEQHGAFLIHGVGRRVELLITDSLKRTHFADWQRISETADFRAINLRGGSHIGKHRRIRQSDKKERYICFVLPTSLVERL